MLANLRVGKYPASCKGALGVFLYLGIFILIILSGITGPPEVTIYVDGYPETVRTYRTHVAEIIALAGIELREEDRIYPTGVVGTERELWIHKAFPVYLRLDGRIMKAYSTGETVAELTQRLTINPSSLDRVRPSWQSLVRPGQEIVIDRVELAKEIILADIDSPTLYRSTETLPRGTTRIEEEGSAGLMERVYRLILVNGRVEERNRQAFSILKDPEPRIILQGTAPRETRVSRGAVRVGDTWQGMASWYGGDGDGFHGLRTANGEIFDSNDLTAAHPFLPFHTVVLVTHLGSGKNVEVRINDRGPFIGGRIIDLSRAAAEAIGMRHAGVARVKLEIRMLP